MLQIKNIHKKYVTGDLVQQALNDVTFNLRDSEFVAVLGQSGSGKTTLLNIIGGLDRYDSGDVIINGISTKKYTDRDWDSYRNHTIGFVFQSYNLIPHQSILANVELALTISGISKSDRKKRAKKALEEVGLGGQLHKKPNQMSGGQMQRVAIARALVNDPDILLADEPTGALDSETSKQVMELLQEVAKNRLVVMVTHNPELADEYANRIVKLRDGELLSDSNPYEVDEKNLAPAKHKNMGKASMSFGTALSLSFNNLRTKKGRTLLTAFAGSIGIIGIALILSLSNGVNAYIASIQKDVMSSYPITVEAKSFDISSMIDVEKNKAKSDVNHGFDAVYSNSKGIKQAQNAKKSMKENNLTEFKKYLENPDSDIHKHVGSNGISYSYNTSFNAYAYDPDGKLVNTDGSDFSAGSASTMLEETTSNQANPMADIMGDTSSKTSPSNFTELLPGAQDVLISPAVTDKYDVLHGGWPQKYDEVILALDKNNEISTSTLYELGILPSSEYKQMLEKLKDGKDFEIVSHNWSYADICNQKFHMIPGCDYYTENKNGLFDDIRNKNNDEDKNNELKKLLESSIELKVVGVARPTGDSSQQSSISSSVGYTRALTDYIIDHTKNSSVVQAQEKTPEINVLNGLSFKPKNDKEKIADTIKYLSGLNTSDKADFALKATAASMSNNDMKASGIPNMSEAELAAMLDQYLKQPQEDTLLMIHDAYISSSSYDKNMSNFGLISRDAPSSISIFVDGFEQKDAISKCIKDYNKSVSTENQITYTDFAGLFMSTATQIINIITYVLVAFVAVALIVSSIMIGIITFISVLERTKEIGILRAIGASKGNVSQIFNAETFIIGLISGLLGVGITALFLIPINAIVHLFEANVNASLPISSAAILVALSMILSLIAGVIPSKKAAKKDPVIALRSE